MSAKADALMSAATENATAHREANLFFGLIFSLPGKPTAASAIAKAGPAGGRERAARCPLPVARRGLPVVSCQLSVVSCQLSVVSCQKEKHYRPTVKANAHGQRPTIQQRPQTANRPQPTIVSSRTPLARRDRRAIATRSWSC